MSHHGKAHPPAIPNTQAEAQLPNPTNRTSPIEQQTQTNRPVGPGAGIHRGDRRDTHPSFATGKGGRGSTAGKSRDGGRSGPLGASGRKSGPKAN